MTKVELRRAIADLAFALLLDPHGINEIAWQALRKLLLEVDAHTFIGSVHATDGRFYLPE